MQHITPISSDAIVAVRTSSFSTKKLTSQAAHKLRRSVLILERGHLSVDLFSGVPSGVLSGLSGLLRHALCSLLVLPDQ